MRHAVALAIVLGLGGCPAPKPAETTPAGSLAPKDVIAAAKGTIEQWRQAYEVRSFDALAKLYAHEIDLVVVHDGTPIMGWSAVEPVLRERLGKAREIHVRLKDVTVASLGPTAAAALATMTREISDGVTTVTENGALTLVLRRSGDGWQIVQEHYSFKRPS